MKLIRGTKQFMYNGAILLSQKVKGSNANKIKITTNSITPVFSLLDDFKACISKSTEKMLINLHPNNKNFWAWAYTDLVKVINLVLQDFLRIIKV